jgi:hypothetical protein
MTERQKHSAQTNATTLVVDALLATYVVHLFSLPGDRVIVTSCESPSSLSAICPQFSLPDERSMSSISRLLFRRFKGTHQLSYDARREATFLYASLHYASLGRKERVCHLSSGICRSTQAYTHLQPTKCGLPITPYDTCLSSSPRCDVRDHECHM